METEIKLDKVIPNAADDLLQKSSTGSHTVYTGKGVRQEVLVSLEKALQRNNEITVVLTVDLEDESSGDIIRNLDIINYIPSVQRLEIAVRSLVRLDDLSNLNQIKNLKLFRLIGYFKDNISLNPIERLTEIENFEMERGFKKNHYAFVNKLSALKRLKIQIFDVSAVSRKPTLEKLWINHTLKNHYSLPEIFPNLTEIALVRCLSIEDFSFLDELIRLNTIKLWYMPQLKIFPKLKNISKNIKELSLITVKNIEDVENILLFKNLERLAITDISKIPAQKFEEFSALEKLTHLYTRFANNKENDMYEEICRKNGWISNNF